ncbi:MAG: alpha/beta hydrolase-fold protein [Acidobacteria bacterium]|nr:alpha/beta hydrolase-fold protein [Acidobacteriota bacterium]
MVAFRLLYLCLIAVFGWGAQPFFDRTHPSKIFAGPRHYRIFLPPDYAASAKAYPVVYYFHGSADRYTLEKYDNGTDTVPKIAAFVAGHDLIVVAVDGYVAKSYPGFYGGSPWDIGSKDPEYDFGEYFREMVAHIDGNYRTLTDRRNRGTSGLSMGGFMSLWLSARYPDLIGSASSFNSGPEFQAGDKGHRVLWRPKDHVSSHEQVMVRLIRASGDYISQYHEETREAYARAPKVNFEFRRDEYHRHWATSIAETLEFHMRAFAQSALDNVPVVWSHDDPYSHFSLWGYDVRSEGPGEGLTYLEDVSQGGLRVRTRQWAPDGPSVERKIRIVTPPLYRAGAAYVIMDRPLAGGSAGKREQIADAGGQLTIDLDGAGHQVSILGQGTGAQAPVLLPVTTKDFPRVMPDRETRLPIRIYNPRGTSFKNLKVRLSSEYPTVQLVQAEAEMAELGPGETVDLSDRLLAKFVSGGGYYAPARIQVELGHDGTYEKEPAEFDVLIAPSTMGKAEAVEILDGRTKTFSVFRQKGNQGGGGPIQRTVTEGKGNGNGILEPGEEATVWVKNAQGLDPFDKGNWYRAKVRGDSPWLEEVGDIQEQKQLEWTGAKERTSVVRLSPSAPAGAGIPVILDNESWSYTFTPDVRYGKERLYQAYQLHARHLNTFDLGAPKHLVGQASRPVH